LHFVEASFSAVGEALNAIVHIVQVLVVFVDHAAQLLHVLLHLFGVLDHLPETFLLLLLQLFVSVIWVLLLLLIHAI